MEIPACSRGNGNSTDLTSPLAKPRVVTSQRLGKVTMSVDGTRKSYAGYEPMDIVVTEAMMRDARAVAGLMLTHSQSLRVHNQTRTATFAPRRIMHIAHLHPCCDVVCHVVAALAHVAVVANGVSSRTQP